MYSSRHVCALFNVTSETVRNWSEEFARHLTENANPGKGKHRNFMAEDMEVLAYISERKKQGVTYDQIHDELDLGNRGAAPTLDPTEAQALVSTERESKLILQIEHLNLSLVRLKEERDEAIKHAQEATKYREKSIELETELRIVKQNADERIAQLAKELDDTRREIKELYREVGQSYVKGVMENLPKKQDDAQ